MTMIQLAGTLMCIFLFLAIVGSLKIFTAWLKQFVDKQWNRYQQRQCDKRFVKWQMSQRYSEPVTFTGYDTSEFDPYQALHMEYVWADEVHGDMRN